RLARRMGQANRERRAVAAALARGAARLPLLAAWVATPRLRTDRVPDDDRRGLGRRVPKQHVQDLRGARLPKATAHRALEPHVDGDLASGAAHRPRPGARPVVSPLA